MWKWLVGVIALVAAALLYIAGHAVISTRGEMEAHHVAIPPQPAGHEAITFQTKDGLTLHGWLHQGSNDALVVLAHGHGQTRVDRLPEANALEAKGFSTLNFDLRAHGESQGDDSFLGDKERLDLAAAIDAGLARTHATRLGLFGFSIGGVAAQDVAWKDERVLAVVDVAPDPDIRRGLESDFKKWGPISTLPSLHVAEHHGVDLSAGHWNEALPVLAKRGLLLIVGSKEFDMPLNRALLKDAAAAGAETWEVEGAQHGEYAKVAPQAYPERVADFFVRHLITP
jgi:pimeloyl-ACP methyl ester carboxylesterase